MSVILQSNSNNNKVIETSSTTIAIDAVVSEVAQMSLNKDDSSAANSIFEASDASMAEDGRRVQSTVPSTHMSAPTTPVVRRKKTKKEGAGLMIKGSRPVSNIDKAVDSAARKAKKQQQTVEQRQQKKTEEQYKYVKLWTDMMDGIIASLEVRVDYIKVKDETKKGKTRKQRVVCVNGGDLVEWLSIYIDVHFPARLKDNSEVPLRERARKLANMLMVKKIIQPVDKRTGKWASQFNLDGEWVQNSFEDKFVYEFQGEYLDKIDFRLEQTKMEQSNFKGNSLMGMLKGKARAQTELTPEELEARKHEMKTTVHTNYVGHEVAGGAELQDLIIAEFKLPKIRSSRTSSSQRDSTKGSSRRSTRNSERKESSLSLVSLNTNRN